jgi:hypothetical protein
MSRASTARHLIAVLGAMTFASCGVPPPQEVASPQREEQAAAPPAANPASAVSPPTASFSPLVQPSAMHQYLGCFRDQGTRSGTEGRDLDGSFSNDPRMNTQMCVDQCRAKGFAYAGTQRSTYCFCGNSYGRSGPAENCSARCAGKSNEVCGGVWSNSVYAIGTLAVRAPAIDSGLTP